MINRIKRVFGKGGAQDVAIKETQKDIMDLNKGDRGNDAREELRQDSVDVKESKKVVKEEGCVDARELDISDIGRAAGRWYFKANAIVKYHDGSYSSNYEGIYPTQAWGIVSMLCREEVKVKYKFTVEDGVYVYDMLFRDVNLEIFRSSYLSHNHGIGDIRFTIKTWIDEFKLRPLVAKDVYDYWGCFRDIPKEFLVKGPGCYDEAKEEIEEKNLGDSLEVFVVEADRRFAGIIELNQLSLDNHFYSCNIMGVAHPSFRGAGIGAEALGRVIDLAFEKYPWLVRIEGTCRAHNVPSAKTMERAGMVLEGRMRKRKCVDGVFYDDHVYAVVRDN